MGMRAPIRRRRARAIENFTPVRRVRLARDRLAIARTSPQLGRTAMTTPPAARSVHPHEAAFRPARRRWKKHFAGASARFAAALFAGTVAAAGEEIWIGPASGQWSANANWADGSAPAAGGDATLALRFTNPASAAITATDNLAGAFLLNQLLLENTALSAFGITASPGATLQFTGAAPALGMLGPGNFTISAGLVLNPSSGSVAVTGAGFGNLTISSAITQTGGARGLVISAAPASPNVSTITLAGSNSFTGGVTLQSGNLALGSNAALGTGLLTVNGGTLQLTSPFTIANTISLNADLLVTTPSPASVRWMRRPSTSRHSLAPARRATCA